MTAEGTGSDRTNEVLYRETHQEIEASRVFVAAGSAPQLALISDMLRMKGCEVIEASDGMSLVSELIASLTGDPPRAPDLIILSSVLPVWTGIEVLARLRRFDRITPVILLASQDAQLSSRELDELAVDVVLHSPFDYAQLLDVAGALLAK